MPQLLKKHQIAKARPVKSRQAGYSKYHAQKAISWIESNLKFVRGQWSATPFTLQPWQKQIVGDVFGTLTEKGLRQYKVVYIEVPRKAGKSTLISGIGNYLLFQENDPNAQIIVCASDRNQAGAIFESCRDQIWASAELDARSKTYRQQIRNLRNGSTLKVISSDAHRAHGLDVSAALLDELHAWEGSRGRALYDAIMTGRGARPNSLVVIITTAGHDRHSVCWEVHEYAERVRDGVVDDKRFYPVIFTAGDAFAWDSEEAFASANPSFGVTVPREFYLDEVARARQSFASRAAYERLYLNRWTASETYWLTREAWDACDLPLPDDEELKQIDACGGLDLSMSTDLSAFNLTWLVASDPWLIEHDETYAQKWWFWMPEGRVSVLETRDKVPYRQWIREGWIKTTPGDVVDYAFIRQEINSLRAAGYQIGKIALDRWNATKLATELTEDGFDLVEFGQGFASMNAPSKMFESLVYQKRIRHGGNPVMRWMVPNTMTQTDAAGNIKPTKAKSTGKIDGVVAGIMPLGVLAAQPMTAPTLTWM